MECDLSNFVVYIKERKTSDLQSLVLQSPQNEEDSETYLRKDGEGSKITLGR